MTKAARICITVNTFPGQGGGPTLVDIYYTILSRKYDVVVLTMPPPGNHAYNIRTISRYALLIHVASFPQNLLYTVVGLLRLLQLHKEQRLKVVLAQDGVFTGFFSVVFGRLTRTPVIIMDYGAVTNFLDYAYWYPPIAKVVRRTLGSYRLYWFRTQLLRATAYAAMLLVSRWANTIMVTGLELRDAYGRVLGTAQAKLRSYDYAIDTNEFRPVDNHEKTALRQRLGMPANVIVINFTSRLDPEKGIEYLLPALKKILTEFEEVRVVVVGRGWLTDFVTDFVKHNHLESRIFLCGEQGREHVKECLQASDIFVYCGTSGSNVSLSVLEAASCGCAVIATDSPKYHRRLFDGTNGLVIPTRDEASLYSAIRLLVEKPMVRRQIAKRGRDRIVRLHSLELLERQLSFV